jgi:GNAT superfamily N-acetyltransferase
MTPQKATVADLPKIQRCAEEFYAASQFLTGFDLERFSALWKGLLESEAGVIFSFDDNDGQWAGMLGGMAYPDIYSGVMTASEMFWYVRDGHRGQGIKLYRAFEEWARERECKVIRMVHLADVMPEKVARFYEKVGFVMIETHFSKTLL